MEVEELRIARRRPPYVPLAGLCMRAIRSQLICFLVHSSQECRGRAVLCCCYRTEMLCLLCVCWVGLLLQEINLEKSTFLDTSSSKSRQTPTFCILTRRQVSKDGPSVLRIETSRIRAEFTNVGTHPLDRWSLHPTRRVLTGTIRQEVH
jgi:hypothetical protein